MKKHTYKVISEHSDPSQTLIEKGGITAQFTLADLESEQKQFQKMIDEFRSKRSFEDAKVQNIEHFHPFVLDFDDEKRSTIFLYQEAKVTRDACDRRIEQIDAELQESLKETEKVRKALGLKTKAQAVDEAVAKITEPEHG